MDLTNAFVTYRDALGTCSHITTPNLLAEIVCSLCGEHAKPYLNPSQCVDETLQQSGPL